MRREMNEFADSSAQVSRTHYNRLLAISAVDLFFNFPSLILEMVIDISVEKNLDPHLVSAWPGWKIAHSRMNMIGIADASWRVNALNRASTYYNWWKNVAFALVFLLLFGISKDMRGKYLAFFYKCARPLGIRPPMKQGPILPAMSFQPGLAGNNK